MLELTGDAIETVKELTSSSLYGSGVGGVRITIEEADGEVEFRVDVVSLPAEDELVEQEDARVFLDPETAVMLDEKVRQALEDRPVTVFGDGSQTRSFCYVDDLIHGLYLLMGSDEHLPVNIGNPIELTLLELAKTVRDVIGASSEIVYEALPVDDPQVRQPDITRARQLLGWEPEVSLDEGLRRMLPTLRREPIGV